MVNLIPLQKKHLCFVLLALSLLLFCPHFLSPGSEQKLKEAYLFYRERRWERTVQSLQNYSGPLPGFAQLLMAQSYQKLSQPNKALDAIDRSAKAPLEKGGATAYEISLLRGRAQLELGRTEMAKESSEQALESARTAGERARALRLQVDIAQTKGDPASALRKGLELAAALELRFIGYGREKLFAELQGYAGEVDPSLNENAEMVFELGGLLKRYGEFQAARDLLSSYQDDMPPDLRQEALLEVAHLDGFRLGATSMAYLLFNRLEREGLKDELKPRVDYYQLLLKERRGGLGDAEESYWRFLRSYPDSYYGKLVARRIFQLKIEGTSLKGVNDALEKLRPYLSDYYLRDSIWHLFFLKCADDNWEQGSSYLDLVSSFYEEPNLQPKIQFWRYKLALQLGGARKAFFRLARSIRIHPLNYYSLRAVEKGWSRELYSLSDLYRKRAKKSPSVKEGEAIERLREVDFSSPKGEGLRQAALSLRGLELFQPALSRLIRLAPDLEKETYLLLKSYWAGGAEDRRESLKTALELQSVQEKQLKETELLPYYTLELLYPLHYQKEARAAAAEFGSPEELIYSVTREESSFNRYAYSTSQAHGLMQIIPSTAKGIAQQLKMKDFKVEDLFSPAVNIRMGTYYLARQEDNFGKILLAPAAYHAGPGNMGRWIDKWGVEDPDLIVELIPYSSTQGYVKRVYRNFLVYNQLYKSL